MVRKRRFGRPNVVPKDIFAYNVGLIGESGIGKTRLMKEVCEKLVGRDGYILLDMGREDGTKAISGVMAEKVTTFDEQFINIDEGVKKEECEHMSGVGLMDIVNDIVKHKDEYYPDLRVLIADTLDQLVEITEPYVIELHNKELRKQGKPADTTTINQAFGGFGKGQDRVIEEILKVQDVLNAVGVSFWIVGHTKMRTKSDILTGTEYDILTTDMQHRYFDAFKNKLHFLGVLTMNRDIDLTAEKAFGGKTKMTGSIASEKRVINFRDDNYSIDSKSRFADIVPFVEYGRDNFINALQDAIDSERAKDTGLDMDKLEKERNEHHAKEQEVRKNAVQGNSTSNVNKTPEELVGEIKERLDGLSQSEQVAKFTIIQGKLKDFGIGALPEATSDQLEEILKSI